MSSLLVGLQYFFSCLNDKIRLRASDLPRAAREHPRVVFSAKRRMSQLRSDVRIVPERSVPAAGGEHASTPSRVLLHGVFFCVFIASSSTSADSVRHTSAKALGEQVVSFVVILRSCVGVLGSLTIVVV